MTTAMMGSYISTDLNKTYSAVIKTSWVDIMQYHCDSWLSQDGLYIISVTRASMIRKSVAAARGPIARGWT